MIDLEEKFTDKMLGKKLHDLTFTFSFRLSVHELQLLENYYPVTISIKGEKFTLSRNQEDKK